MGKIRQRGTERERGESVPEKIVGGGLHYYRRGYKFFLNWPPPELVSNSYHRCYGLCISSLEFRLFRESVQTKLLLYRNKPNKMGYGEQYFLKLISGIRSSK